MSRGDDRKQGQADKIGRYILEAAKVVKENNW
jgi:hypothetical protein